MTRLQKKCLIAVAGAHLLVIVVLLCSGFIKPRPKPDDTVVLDMIPANIIDAAFRSGVRNAEPPPPAVQPQPPEPTPPQPQPPPPEPPKQVEPPPPERTPPPEPKADEPTEQKPKPQHKIDVNLKPVVRNKTTEKDDSQAQAEAEAKAAARAAQKARDARIKAFRNAANSIRESTSSSTTIDMPGGSTEAYADYASVVKTVYTDAWILPDTAASDEANVKVSVTIANDGRVTDAHIVERSGDGSVDNSVQRTLDRVRQIEPFPDGSTDKERTYIINFNLKAKRQLLG